MSRNTVLDLLRSEAVRSRGERQSRLLWPVALLIVSLSLFSPKSARPQGDGADMENIEGIIRTYAKSIDDADTKLASEIWSQTGDVSFIHPGGHEHGWEEIKKNIYEKAMRDTFSERNLKVSNVSIHMYRDAAWAEFHWVFVAKFRSNGSPVRTEGRETQVYRKNDRGWVLVHVHYSGMPVTAEGNGS